MICAIAFGTATLVGLGDDVVGAGIGAWAIGLVLFIIEAQRTKTGYDLGAAELASLVLIAATFAPDAWLDTLVRLGAVLSVGLCELQ